MDRKLAATIGAVAAGADVPPQFGADQRDWLVERNDCPTDTCLREAYQRRLTQLALIVSSTTTAPGGDGIEAESVKAARHWGVPIFQGLPYVPRFEQVGSGNTGMGQSGSTVIGLASLGGLNQVGFLEAYFFQHAPPAMRAWTRMIYALGLATFPDAAAHLDDLTLAKLACIFLDAEAQRALSGGKTCQDLNQGGQGPGTEFVIHDMASGFRSREMPGIIQAAPRLPLRLLIAVPASLSPYDLAAGRFTVRPGYGGDNPVGVFSSPSNAVLGELYWPVQEAEARAIVADQAKQPSFRLYLAIPLTITGTIIQDRSHRSAWNGSTGLPYGTQWRIEAGEITLYGDSGLTRRLYAFGEPQRRPLPLAGTSQADAPRPSGPLPLDAEGAMLVLLHAGQLDPDKVRWNDAANARYQLEQQLRSRADWTHLDPWGTYFAAHPANDPAEVGGYREWSIRRATALPEAIVLRQAFTAAVLPSHLQPLGSEGQAALPGDASGRSGQSKLIRAARPSPAGRRGPDGGGRRAARPRRLRTGRAREHHRRRVGARSPGDPLGDGTRARRRRGPAWRRGVAAA